MVRTRTAFQPLSSPGIPHCRVVEAGIRVRALSDLSHERSDFAHTLHEQHVSQHFLIHEKLSTFDGNGIALDRHTPQ